jgi:uncharacterized membrane protein (UPF0127 family)
MDTIKIANKEIPILIAITSDEQATGLMYRDPPLPAMAFVYSRPWNNQFWMKNVSAPLDIIFCNGGKIVSIRKGLPYSTAIIDSGVPSDLVVELPEGTCKENDFQVGDNVALQLSKSSQLKILLRASW